MLLQLETFYRANFDRFVKRFTRRAGTKEAAEDVVQEAFERALRYFDSYDPARSFDGWFNRILSNSLREYKNKEKGGPTIEFDEEEADGVDCKQYARHLWKQIRDEMELYEDAHKEVLHLYFLHGYRPRDISRVVELRYRNIETILQRFKTFIKEKYNTDL